MTVADSIWARAWSFVAVVIVVVLGWLVVSVLIGIFFGTTGPQETKWLTGQFADVAVMFTAFGVWVEYLRKRWKTRRERENEPDLNTLSADVAVLRDQVNAFVGAKMRTVDS